MMIALLIQQMGLLFMLWGELGMMMDKLNRGGK